MILPLFVDAPVKVVSLPEVPVTTPLLVKKPFIVNVLVPKLIVAPMLTFKLFKDVLTPTVTVLLLAPLPTTTFGRTPVGVKTPKLAVPVNKSVPGPFTPFVVVPLFKKAPVIVNI